MEFSLLIASSIMLAQSSMHWSLKKVLRKIVFTFLIFNTINMRNEAICPCWTSCSIYTWLLVKLAGKCNGKGSCLTLTFALFALFVRKVFSAAIKEGYHVNILHLAKISELFFNVEDKKLQEYFWLDFRVNKFISSAVISLDRVRTMYTKHPLLGS